MARRSLAVNSLEETQPIENEDLSRDSATQRRRATRAEDHKHADRRSGWYLSSLNACALFHEHLLGSSSELTLRLPISHSGSVRCDLTAPAGQLRRTVEVRGTPPV
jgi:hypothetical protein